jgi:hypothetical protein
VVDEKEPVVDVNAPVLVVPRVVDPAVDVMPLLNVTSPEDNAMVIRTGMVEIVAPAATPEADKTSHVPAPFLMSMFPFGLDDRFADPFHHASQ